MPAVEAVRTASCSCGQLQLTARGEPVRISLCHCLACQRRTGSVFGMQARFPRQAVQCVGRSTLYERISDAGARCHYHFCPDCGATVHYTLEGQPDLIAVPVGAFADPAFPPPAFSVYERRRHAWLGLPAEISHSA